MKSRIYLASLVVVLALPLCAQVNVILKDGAGVNSATVSAGGAVKVDGSAATQPVSAVNLPLPTGASTAAKQPAIGTAGSASVDVLSMQGIAGMTPLKTDGSGTTQPISGTVTANQGAANATAWLVTGVGGTFPVTGTFWQATQPVSGTFWQATQPVSGTFFQSTQPVSCATAATCPVNAVPFDGTNQMGVMTNFGTTPTAVKAISANVSLFQGTVAVGTGAPLQVTLANTGANATAVKMDGSAVTQPISAASLPLPTGAATAAKQPALGTAGSASADVLSMQGVASMTPLLAQPVPGTSNGLTPYNLEPGASDNHANIKNGAGLVYHISATNNSATVNYLRLYNAATGFNGCNSATNLQWEVMIPASTTGAGFVEDIATGVTFATGISICVTSGYGQTNTTSATATAMEINIGFK